MNRNTYLGLAILFFCLAFSFDLNLSDTAQGPEWIWVEIPLVAALLASVSLVSVVLCLAAEKRQLS
jgi:hypothetical protein